MYGRQIMLDIETLGVNKNALIVQIAAQEFFPLREPMLGNFLDMNVDLADAAEHGIMDVDTVAWWLKQDSEVRANVFDQSEAIPLWVALKRLRNFVNKNDVEGVWGNGSAFDNEILKSAWKSCMPGSDDIWSYKLDRDMRTIVALNKSLDTFVEPPPEDTDQKHIAIADALWQAKYVGRILRQLHHMREAVKNGK